MKLLKNQGSHTVQRCTTLCILEILGCQAKWYFKCILQLGERSLGLSRWRRGKEPACQRRRHVRHRFDPWVRRISWRRDGNPPQCSCLENPLDRGAWRATVHGVTETDKTEETARTHVGLEGPSGLPSSTRESLGPPWMLVPGGSRVSPTHTPP